MVSEASKQTYIRLTEKMIEDIDWYVEQMEAAQPGSQPSRSDAMRVLINKGLAVAKGEKSGKPRK